jgi:hypothetical protein
MSRRWPRNVLAAVYAHAHLSAVTAGLAEVQPTAASAAS